MLCRQLAGMQDLLRSERPDVFDIQRFHGHRSTRPGHELYLYGLSILIDVYDGAHVATPEAALRYIAGKDHRS